MFKKRNRNFRERKKESVSDDEPEIIDITGDSPLTENGSTNPSIQEISGQPEVVKKPKKSKKKEKPKSMPTSSSVLSFVEDEGILFDIVVVGA